LRIIQGQNISSISNGILERKRDHVEVPIVRRVYAERWKQNTLRRAVHVVVSQNKDCPR
jgi:hypothetical protein